MDDCIAEYLMMMYQLQNLSSMEIWEWLWTVNCDVAMVCLKEASCQSPGMFEENHEYALSCCSVSYPSNEAGTSQILVRHITT
jgi:hypothetical protein